MIEENENAPTEPARVKRHKPKRGLGSAVTRKRRLQAESLQEQIDQRRARHKEAAMRELERLRQRGKSTKQTDNTRFGVNLLRSVISNQTALLRSWGYKTAVRSDVRDVGNVVAWTDFKVINVTWPTKAIPARMNRTAVLDTIAQMKGVMQHEMGHVRFTTSWHTVTEKYSPKAGHPANLLFKCWNMLEDQRMESLVVNAVPRIKNYFGTMVANVCLMGGNVPMEQTWIMLAGRDYLPKPVLRKSYELFDQFCFDQGIKDGALTWYNLVQDYKAASTHKAIVQATEAAYEFIQMVRATMPETVDNMDPMQSNDNDADPSKTAQQRGDILGMFDEKPKPPCKGKGKGEKSDQPGDPSDGEGDGEGDEGEGDGDGRMPNRDDYDEDDSRRSGGTGAKPKDGDRAGKGKGKGEGSEKAKPQPKKDGPPSQSNHGDGSETETQEQDLSDMLEEMGQQFSDAARKDRDVLDMARGAHTATDAEGLDPYPNQGTDMSPELQSDARFTAVGIEKALTSFVTDSAPTWHNRRETGIIDPLAYRTKAVGDRDFRRHLEDKGSKGLDVHVSMLCDVSGSMGGEPIQALSESLYATAIACERLNIGATFTLWSSDNQNYRVWGDGNITPTLWPSMGGTDPTKALDDLDTHNPERAENHLVLIFTDGAWANNFPSIQRWAAPGRTFVLVRYGRYDGEMQKDMGADRHINISNVRQLPEELTKALINVLDQSGGWG